MQRYPPEDYLSGNFLVEKYDFDLLQRTLNSLKIENSLIYLVSKTLEQECPNLEPYFKVKYSSGEIPADLLARMENPSIKPTISKKKIDFPPKNIFIPSNTQPLLTSQIKGKLPRFPDLVLETAGSELFFKQDNCFGSSKACLNLKLFVKE